MIAKEALAAYLGREMDSCAWMKKLPKERIEEELRRFRVPAKFNREPWTHQMVCHVIAKYYPQYMFLLDMGAGKTSIVLNIIIQLLREGKFQRGLVTVPRKINLGSWRDEILNTTNLEPNVVSGVSKEEKWEALVYPKGDITIIDYAGLQYALSTLKEVKKDGKITRKMVVDEHSIKLATKQYNLFDMDESHKSKNKETLRFEILKKLTKRMPYRYGNTGTLFGSNVEDIWAQFYLIDHGETFGDTLGLFREAFFTPVQNKWSGYPDWVFNKGMMRELYRFIHNRSIRYSEHELDSRLPARHLVPIYLDFANEQREHYLRAVQGLINARGQLRELDASYIRMRQIISGFLDWKEDDGRHRVIFKENPKLDAVERVMTEIGEYKIVISHEYTTSGELITKRLKEMGLDFEWLHGGSKDPVNAVRRFLADPNKKAFVMNSEAGGTGTDGLQEQCPYLMFYESPPSPITRQQVLKRVHRPGQRRRTHIIDLIMKKSLDVRILKFLEEGIDMHRALVDGKMAVESLLG